MTEKDGESQPSKETPLQQPGPSKYQLEGTPLEDNQLTDTQRIRNHAFELEEAEANYSMLMRMIGDARFVLLGEATHGTREFYEARAAITRRLIEKKGFNALVVEADWPDAYRVNRYVLGRGQDASSTAALDDFKRFPSWMWRNMVMASFVDWLREHNSSLPESAPPAGFYGLDLYSLHASMNAVIQYLDRVDPQAAQRARFRYSCFEHFGEAPHTYGYAANFGMNETCEREVIEQLGELNRQATDYLRRDGFVAEDEFFYAEQNARISKNAEQYFRSMFQDDVLSWNLRDRHMYETLESLADHLERQGKPVKIVVWAHNSHLGDARATEMGRRGELNLGQLVRQRYGNESFLVGFTTHRGTVTAASDWDGPPERKQVRPALDGSFEWLFHYVGLPRFLLLLQGMKEPLSHLNREMLERAIGVVYRPETERISHYFTARLMEQFDAVIHFDETQAVAPLDRTVEWESGESPETYPSGF